jgi:hypothetical protein
MRFWQRRGRQSCEWEGVIRGRDIPLFMTFRRLCCVYEVLSNGVGHGPNSDSSLEGLSDKKLLGCLPVRFLKAVF